eukprot:COSAG01_NODE_4692_length_4808_cov_9.520493_8_plen_105_part_00
MMRGCFAAQGFYFSMSQVPLFLPKLVAGVMSGRLLAEYCPQGSSCDGTPIWMWVGITSLPFPFLIHFCVWKGWIVEGEGSHSVTHSATQGITGRRVAVNTKVDS